MLNIYGGFWIMAAIFGFLAAIFAISGAESRAWEAEERLIRIAWVSLSLAAGCAITATWLMVAGI